MPTGFLNGILENLTMQTFRKRLPVFVALGLGWIVGGVSQTSPNAVAQVARVTLDSLQTQVNNIVGGTTKVGKASSADNATSLGGFAAANYATAASVATLDASVNAIQSSYLPLSGGSLTGNLSSAGIIHGASGVRVGSSSSPASTANAGTLRFDTTTNRLMFSDGTAWRLVAMDNAPGRSSVLNVTTRELATRTALSNAANITIDSFTVNKVSPTSILVVHGNISGWGAVSGSMSQVWKLGSGVDVNAQSVTFTNELHSIGIGSSVIISGHTTTGNQALQLRYKSQNGSTSDKPFNVLNPNASDDS